MGELNCESSPTRRPADRGPLVVGPFGLSFHGIGLAARARLARLPHTYATTAFAASTAPMSAAPAASAASATARRAFRCRLGRRVFLKHGADATTAPVEVFARKFADATHLVRAEVLPPQPIDPELSDLLARGGRRTASVAVVEHAASERASNPDRAVGWLRVSTADGSPRRARAQGRDCSPFAQHRR